MKLEITKQKVLNVLKTRNITLSDNEIEEIIAQTFADDYKAYPNMTEEILVVMAMNDLKLNPKFSNYKNK